MFFKFNTDKLNNPDENINKNNNNKIFSSKLQYSRKMIPLFLRKIFWEK